MKAGLYIRLSINDSLNDSINNQTNILKEYCYINNISIYDIYIDNGYTGTNYNRPEFNRLIRDIEKNYGDDFEKAERIIKRQIFMSIKIRCQSFKICSARVRRNCSSCIRFYNIK